MDDRWMMDGAIQRIRGSQREAGDGGRPVCMLIKTQEAVYADLNQNKEIQHRTEVWMCLNSGHLCHYIMFLPLRLREDLVHQQIQYIILTFYVALRNQLKFVAFVITPISVDCEV